MEQVYWYCLAYAAKLHGVLVHAACLMSTHCHEVITDEENLPTLPQTQQALPRLRCGFVKWRPLATRGDSATVMPPSC